MSDAWYRWMAAYQNSSDSARVAMLNDLSDGQKHYLRMTLPRVPMSPLEGTVTIAAFIWFLAVLFWAVCMAMSAWFLWFPC